MKDATTPSLVRIRRINYFLGQEPKFATTTTTEDYVKGTDKIPFPKPTWEVARAIHQAELDPCKMDKAQIFEWANFILLHGPAPKEAKTSSTEQPSVKSTTATTVSSVPEEPVATINVPVRVAIYTLLVSARELTRLDRKPDADELGKLIDPVAVRYLSVLNQSEKTYLTTGDARPKQPSPIVAAVPAPAPVVPTPA